jgi:anaerobic selenocysteine-containing dehydrogenase
MLSSFADASAVAQGLRRCGLVVSHDLFLNDTAAAHADIVLPATAWLEELGVKATHTHLYLMPRLLPAAGQARSVYQVFCNLAERLGLADFHPWADEEAMVDAVLDHPNTGRATVEALRAEGGMRPLAVSHVAYPSKRFDTSSGKIEFFSAAAQAIGLPPLPVFDDSLATPAPDAPLRLAQGRTLLHFHGFYNNGRVLPTLARREAEPRLWLAPQDAAARGIADGAAIRIFNPRGEMKARAQVTDRIPAGTVWMRDGWPGLNRLTSGEPVLPDAVVDRYPFSAGQARYSADVQVALQDLSVE